MNKALRIDSFWEFSNRLYALEGAEAACIALQDEHGLDVIAVLACLYAAARRHAPLEDEAMRRVLTAAQPWAREVVAPLRAARRALKRLDQSADVRALRTAIKTVELDAERLIIDALEPLLRPDFKNSEEAFEETALANVKAYLKHAHPQADAGTWTHLRALIRLASG